MTLISVNLELLKKMEILLIYFLREILIIGIGIKETDILKKANNQLKEYLSGQRKNCPCHLAPSGTEFMKNVWNCLCAISYGETKSYKEIAETIGNPKLVGLLVLQIIKTLYLFLFLAIELLEQVVN